MAHFAKSRSKADFVTRLNSLLTKVGLNCLKDPYEIASCIFTYTYRHSSKIVKIFTLNIAFYS